MPEEGSLSSNSAATKLPDFNNRREVFHWAVARMDEQRTANREKVRATMKDAGFPVPPEIVAKLAQLGPEDVREVLHDHPGYAAWKQYRSYQISLRVFERSLRDVIEAIERFEGAAEDDILGRAQKDKLTDIEEVIQKELFAVVNAAHSLVDHSTRRLQPLVNISGYTIWLTQCFSDDGLHEFVIGLRTLLHHLHNIRATWSIENHFEKGKKASFTLNRKQVQYALNQSPKSFGKDKLTIIRAYLSKSSEPINLKLLFEEYQRRAAKFHRWYNGALASESLIELRDCERCLQANKNFGTCLFWKAMVGNWLNWREPPNPYDHLHRYLNPDQIAEVYRLPMQSEQQVDKVIEFMDTDNACDADLRRQAYEFFRRAKPPLTV